VKWGARVLREGIQGAIGTWHCPLARREHVQSCGREAVNNRRASGRQSTHARTNFTWGLWSKKAIGPPVVSTECFSRFAEPEVPAEGAFGVRRFCGGAQGVNFPPGASKSLGERSGQRCRFVVLCQEPHIPILVLSDQLLGRARQGSLGDGVIRVAQSPGHDAWFKLVNEGTLLTPGLTIVLLCVMAQ